jgi:hypothetical protein
MIIAKNFLFIAMRFYATMQIQIWVSEGPLASFSLFAALHISVFLSAQV